MRKTTALAGMIVCLALMKSVAAQPEQESNVRDHLVQQIRAAETVHRDDLLEDAVERLYRIEPRAPEGLAAEIYLAVKREEAASARLLLEQLEHVAPDSEHTRGAKTLIRIHTTASQNILAQARLYASVGRIEEARQAYDSVFQGVYPTADLAVEYWLLRSRESDSRELAVSELKKLLEQYPQHPRILLALANFSFADGHAQRALSYLRSLSRIGGQREVAANREYEYLSTLSTSPATLAAWEDFSERYAELPIRARAHERFLAQDALLSNPIWRAAQAAQEKVNQGAGAAHLRALQAGVAAYPENPEFHGALGLVYLRMGERSKAVRQFEVARQKEPLVDRASRWVSLERSTRQWLTLERADQLLAEHNWSAAKKLYAQVRDDDPSNLFAHIGLGDVALNQADADEAWIHIQRALTLQPDHPSAQNAAERYLSTLSPGLAIQQIDALSPHLRHPLTALRTTFLVARYEAEANEALAVGDPQRAVKLLEQAQTLDLDDPWLSYRLASLQLQYGQRAEAFEAYDRHLLRHPSNLTSLYAQALLFESVDAWPQVIANIEQIDESSRTEDMLALLERAQSRNRIAQAQILFEAGHHDQAIALLEDGPQNIIILLQRADWANATGDHQAALSAYQSVLTLDPENQEALLGQLETRIEAGQAEWARAKLKQNPLRPLPQDFNASRRLANIWAALGENERALALIAHAADHATTPQPLLHRDYARLLEDRQPQKALQSYHKAMLDAGLLALPSKSSPRDDLTFTRAMRVNEEDGWMERSIRADADRLYQRQNPTIHLSNDEWIRSDGTPGTSRLRARTNVLQLNHPLGSGSAFLRAEHIRLDAGTLEVSDTGEIIERFGTCGLTEGVHPSRSDCMSGRSQKVQGTGFAAGWQSENLELDLGRTPHSFALSNWVGGVTLRGDAGQAGWRLSVSRRPLSSSLLSFAGTTDPGTGTTWGGIVATGATLGLSWDQGLSDGLWTTLSYHKLTGTHVATNTRTRIMGGYYRRLINEPHKVLSLGVNAMHWRHQYDLGQYTLGQGGYYSPQRYSSVSFPLVYAQRGDDWSFSVRGAVSRSTARSNSGTGGGWGYTLSGTAERRLNSHWVLGAGFDLQKGRDYQPSRLMLYARYTFNKWQGSLPLAPAAPVLHADFN